MIGVIFIDTYHIGMPNACRGHYETVSTLRPLIVGGLNKKRGLAIFPEEINGEGVNKWKWVDFVMQCCNKGGCQ